jgi:NTE family protein
VRVSATDLSVTPLFDDVDEATRALAAARATTVGWHRGEVLAQQGEHADAFYILLDGSVEVEIVRDGREEEFVDVLGRGDCIGDMALLLGSARTATVRALKDCRAIRFSAADFDWLLAAAPAFGTELARTIGRRLERTTHRIRRRPIERIALLAATPALDLRPLRADLAEVLRAPGGRLPAGLPPPEAVAITAVSWDLGVAPADLSAEARAALQHADAILLVGDAGAPPPAGRLGAVADLVAGLRPHPRLDLVLLHRSAPPHRGTAAWLGDARPTAWHHVRLGSRADLARLARRVVGSAVGLALSGGGARGFAHIGVLRALAEAGTPVDVVGGASMGAIVAAQHAIGLGPDEMAAVMRRSYLDRRGVRDLAIPWVAVRTGAATDAVLRQMVGDVRIEDLAVPFFCVSSDLVAATTVVHETGPLWQALRASCSLPGLVPPVRSRGRFLIDGGLLDNLPVDVMRERCSGSVIASDVSVAVDPMVPAVPPRRRLGVLAPPADLPGIYQILLRTVQLASVRDSREHDTPADLALRPPVEDVGMGDFARLDECVARGRAHTREELLRWGT